MQSVTYPSDLFHNRPAEKLVTVKADNKKIPLYSIHSNPLRSEEFAVSGREEYARVYDRRMLRGDDSTTPVKRYCPHHLQGLSDTKGIQNSDKRLFFVYLLQKLDWNFTSTHICFNYMFVLRLRESD